MVDEAVNNYIEWLINQRRFSKIRWQSFFLNGLKLLL